MDELVTLVDGIYAAFGRGEIDAVLAQFHSTIEWVTPANLPWSKGRYYGFDGVSEYFHSFGTALRDASIQPAEFMVGSDLVVAFGHERSVVRSTGRTFRARFAHVWSIEDGKVSRFEGVIDTAAVLEAFAA